MAGSAPWLVFPADPLSSVDPVRWGALAERFLNARVGVVVHALEPLRGEVVFEVATRKGDAAPTRVRAEVFPIESLPQIVARARAAVQAIGGAGFDALIDRARCVWRIDSEVAAGDPRAPLVAATIVALALTAPIVPPDGTAIFGVKTARVELEKVRWPAPR